MHDIVSVTQDDIVLALLRAEINSPNSSDKVSLRWVWDETLIWEPDLLTKKQKALRTQSLVTDNREKVKTGTRG